MRLHRWSVPVVLALAASLLTGCTPPGGAESTAPNDEATHKRFGTPAVAAPAGFTYQPDVKVVGGGRNSVLGGSADGLRWRFDSAAEGLANVAVGDVLWATAMVVGRVVSISRGPVETVAVLAPVALTDVIKDGTISYDTPLDPDDVGFLTTDIPAVTPLDAGASAVPAAYTKPVASHPGEFPAWKDGKTGGIGGEYQGYEVGINYAPNGLNISVARNQGFKLQLDFGLRFHRFRVQSRTVIAGGKVSSSQTVLRGLDQLTVGLTGGAASPAADNTRVRIEVPATIQAQVLEAPPLVVQLRVNLLVATAFTGKNATIGASATWKLKGDVGTAGGKDFTPTFAVQKSLTDSIGGLSLGPSGIVVGFSIRVLGGLGIPGFAAGPYAKLAVVVGVTNGSSLGAPLVRCRGGTLDINWATGAAVGINSELLNSIIKKIGDTPFSDRIKASAEASIEKSRSIVSRTVVRPDVPLCRG